MSLSIFYRPTIENQGDGSVVGDDLFCQHRTHIKSWIWWYLRVRPVLGRQKQEKPQGSQANQPSLTNKPRIPVRDPLLKSREAQVEAPQVEGR